MDIQVEDQQNAKVITLHGRLDALLAPKLEEVFEQSGMPNGKPFIVDMANVPVLTAEGVRVLLNAQIASGNPDLLSLKSPVADVKQLLITVGLENLIVDAE